MEAKETNIPKQKPVQRPMDMIFVGEMLLEEEKYREAYGRLFHAYETIKKAKGEKDILLGTVLCYMGMALEGLDKLDDARTAYELASKIVPTSVMFRSQVKRITSMLPGDPTQQQ